MGIQTFIVVVVIAFCLAMDAFAVSVASTVAYKRLKIGHVLRMAFFFGLFQAVMPMVGYLAGESFKGVIAEYDHWVAFALLAGIGAKMIYESLKFKAIEEQANPASIGVLIMLSIATSIDALAVGVTISLITEHILAAVAIIGVITFVLSYIGCEIGRRVGHFFEKRIETVAGVVLIGIGVKILVSHLFFGS